MSAGHVLEPEPLFDAPRLGRNQSAAQSDRRTCRQGRGYKLLHQRYRSDAGQSPRNDVDHGGRPDGVGDRAGIRRDRGFVGRLARQGCGTPGPCECDYETCTRNRGNDSRYAGADDRAPGEHHHRERCAGRWHSRCGTGLLRPRNAHRNGEWPAADRIPQGRRHGDDQGPWSPADPLDRVQGAFADEVGPECQTAPDPHPGRRTRASDAGHDLLYRLSTVSSYGRQSLRRCLAPRRSWQRQSSL